MKKISCVIFLLLLTAGCEHYSFNLNDNTLYEPPTLFRNYTVVDKGLRQCLAETISELKVYEAEHLNILRCSHADITSTEGLNKFTHITVLDLSDNNLKAAPELFELTHLRHLNLAGNEQLPCTAIAMLAQNIAQLIPPAHCNK